MRALRILLVTVVVLGGIFVAVDRAAVYFAESEVEGRVQVTGATIGSTDVSIKGFPFLTQVAGGRPTRSTSRSPASRPTPTAAESGSAG